MLKKGGQIPPGLFAAINTQDVKEMTTLEKRAGNRVVPPKIMLEMTPRCLSMVFPTMLKEERFGFVVKMVSLLIEQCCTGLPEEEKENFFEKVIGKLKA